MQFSDESSSNEAKNNPEPSTSSANAAKSGQMKIATDADGNITQIKFPAGTFDNDPLQKCMLISKSGKSKMIMTPEPKETKEVNATPKLKLMPPTDKENADNAEKFLQTLSPSLASNPEIQEKSKILQDFIDKLKGSEKKLEGLSKIMEGTIGNVQL